MNTKNLSSNTKVLAVILSVAVCAIVGTSLAYAQTTTTPEQNSQTTPQIQGSVNLQKMLLTSIQTKFSDAASTAAGAVTNGQVIGGSLSVIQGSVVYNFRVFDGTNIYSVVIDAGNGKVLYTSQGHPMEFGALLGGGHHKMGGSHMGAGAWKHNQPPTTSPSTTTPPTGT